MIRFPVTKCWVFFAILTLAASSVWCAEANNNPLVGRWLVTRVGIRDATKVPVKIEWEFTKDTVIVRDLTHSQEVSRNKYSVDLTKNPKWITVTVVDQVTEIRQGIFRITEGELHIRQGVGGTARPDQFSENSFTIMKKQPERNAAPNK